MSEEKTEKQQVKKGLSGKWILLVLILMGGGFLALEMNYLPKEFYTQGSKIKTPELKDEEKVEDQVDKETRGNDTPQKEVLISGASENKPPESVMSPPKMDKGIFLRYNSLLAKITSIKFAFSKEQDVRESIAELRKYALEISPGMESAFDSLNASLESVYIDSKPASLDKKQKLPLLFNLITSSPLSKVVSVSPALKDKPQVHNLRFNVAMRMIDEIHEYMYSEAFVVQYLNKVESHD